MVKTAFMFSERIKVNNLKGVFFDLDGTLVDSIPILKQTYFDFLEKHGVAGSEDEFQTLNGPALREVIRILKDRYGFVKDSDTLLIEYLDILKDKYRYDIKFTEGNIQILNHLKSAGYILYLVTSSPGFLIEPLLQREGLKTVFSGCIFGDDVLNAKPHPEIYLKAINASGLMSDQIMVVEDSINGINSAKDAELIVCGITGTHDALFLKESRADFVIDSIEELCNIQ